MGKPTGFLEYERKTSAELAPKDRIKNFNEFHTPLNRDEQRKQAARCMDCGVPFCQAGMNICGMTSGCPLNNLIPEWNDMLYNDNLEQAFARLSKTNCFPEFTSRVCPALCEKACTCNLNGDPVSVRENERAIIEYAFANDLVNDDQPKVHSGKKVAVIGSGPSGLAVADQLIGRGHDVTVYERSDRPGGLLMYGIPNMKLEKQIIDRRIDVMKKRGIKFVLNTEVATGKASAKAVCPKDDQMTGYLKNKNLKYVKAEELLKEYDAVVLACGAANPRDIKAPGRDSKGIYFAVDFLKTTTMSLVNSGFADKQFVNCKGKNVLVIGGGDTGNDCVGTAVREGAVSVTQLEMMPKAPDTRTPDNPWPEWPKICKTDYGQQEAIAVYGHDPRIYETTVKEFIKDKDGNVKAAKCVKLDWKKNPETGRMTMTEIEGSEYIVDCDVVLIAAGFLGCQTYVAESFGVELNERTNVKTPCPKSYTTNVPKVFVAGDMHRGQSLVVWAIREGREAAMAVEELLLGYTNLQ